MLPIKRNRFAGKGKNKRSKSNLKTGRDYSYDSKYQSSPGRVAYRIELNRKRRALLRKGTLKIGDNRDVAHKVSFKKGGTLKKGYALINRRINRAKKE